MGLKFAERALVGIYILSFCLITTDSTSAQNITNTKHEASEGNKQTFPQMYNLQSDKRNTYPLVEVNPPSTSDEDTSLAIINCRLIDGLGDDPIENGVVIIKGNRIIEAGAWENVEIPDGVDRYDADGKTLMPGLIDVHFHSVMDNKGINRHLRNGITTMRDPGHPFKFYQSLEFAEMPLPRVYLDGAHLDGYPPAWPQQAIVIKGANHARKVVYDHIKDGATGIKIYFRLPLEYYEVITSTASQFGVPVMAHLELVEAVDAIRAGIDGIEHITSFGTDLADPNAAKAFKRAVRDNPDARRDGRYRLWAKIDLESKNAKNRAQEVADLAIKNGLFVTPTIALFNRKKGGKGVRDYHIKGFQNMIRFIEILHKRGVKITVGSHGHGYKNEMELLVKAGMKPMEVITSSTIMNAKYLHAEQRLGSIESGKLADLLLIEGNPAEDITKMKNIDRIMFNGQWIDPEGQ